MGEGENVGRSMLEGGGDDELVKESNMLAAVATVRTASSRALTVWTLQQLIAANVRGEALDCI